MQVTIFVPLLVCIVGALLFALSSSATLREIGRAMLWCGLLVSLFTVSGHTFHF